MNNYYKQIYNIFTLKFVFQAMDVLFKYLMIKKLSVTDVGIYLYLLSIVFFFLNFSTLGLPIYLQKQIASTKPVDRRYISLTALVMVLSAIIAYLLVPAKAIAFRDSIVCVIVIYAVVNLISAICNGIGAYDYKYKFLATSNLYTIILPICLLFNKPITLQLIIFSFLINAFVYLFYAVLVWNKTKHHMTVVKSDNNSVILIFIDLLLIYVVTMPYDFSRFYDRFLLNHFFSATLLGVYVFNNYLVMGIYTMFVKPMMSVCITVLAKTMNDIKQQAIIMCRYYILTLAVFLVIFIGYVPFSKEWLELLGLTNYLGTTNIFIYTFLNTFLYALSIPFVIKISIDGNNVIKSFYCIASLFIFNIPLIFVYCEHSFNSFLLGFLTAFTLHLIAAVMFNYSYAKPLFKLMWYEIYKLIKGESIGFIAFINPINKEI